MTCDIPFKTADWDEPDVLCCNFDLMAWDDIQNRLFALPSMIIYAQGFTGYDDALLSDASFFFVRKVIDTLRGFEV